MRSPSLREIAAYLLTFAVLLILSTILLCNDYEAPSHILFAAALPAAVAPFLLGTRRDSFKSLILLAALGYILSLLAATITYGRLPLAAVSPYLPCVLGILGFLAVFCMLARAYDGFARVLCDGVTIICAVSATLNSLAFFQQDMSWGVIANFRLVPYIGIPAYQGSTTISATYAIYFVYAFSVVTASGRPRWQKVVLGLAGACLLIGLIATQGRGAYLGALAGVVAVSVASSRRNRRIAIAFVVVAALAALYPPFTAAMLYRGDGYREGIWLSYLHMAAERPLWGYGVLTDVRRMVEGHLFDHAHDTLLSAEIRGGLPGLVSVTVLLGASLYWSAAQARRQGDPAILGMVVALATAALLDYELRITYPDWTWVTFWAPLGLAAGVEVRLRAAARGLLARHPGMPEIPAASIQG